MTRVNWVKIAQLIEKEYVTRTGEGYQCRICGSEIVPEKDAAFSRYAALYRHFKENHPDIVEKLKAQAGSGKTTTTAVRVASIESFLQ